MFIGRRGDLTIYGLWTVRQWDGQEELADNHPEVLAFLAPTQAFLDNAARRQAIHDDVLRVDLQSRLSSATNLQISSYVDTVVVDLASAKTLLKKILLLIALDSRNGI